jgi:transposase InsO family protein
VCGVPADHGAYYQTLCEMQSLLTLTEPWTVIAIDFITELLASSQSEGGQKYEAVLVVVDRYTKSARYYRVTSDITAPQLANLIARKLMLGDTGFPSSIVTDRGTHFTSKFWTTLCYHLRMMRGLSSAYHPQKDG